MQHRIENLSFLAAGIAVFYALNQHLIGHGMIYTCQSITSQQNNFVAEIGIMAFMALAVFGGYSCCKTAPIFSVFAASLNNQCFHYAKMRSQTKN